MALVKCKECGEEISDEASKCVHCGAKVILTIECSECHKEYDKTTNICPYCGKKNSRDIRLEVKKDVNNLSYKVKNNKKKFILITGIIVLFIIVGVLCVNFIPSMFVSVDEYLSNGEYEKAYKKCKTEETKNNVLLENVIAKISYEISDGLKDPSSFNLSHVYYDGEDELVFEVVAKNSYGGNVTNYYDYRYDDDDHEYSLFLYLSSLENEKTYSWETSSEKLQKSVKNVVRTTVKNLISDSQNKLDDDMIDRVNNLFKENKLRDVELISEIDELYPKSSSENTVY